jgi:hypothetical protein
MSFLLLSNKIKQSRSVWFHYTQILFALTNLNCHTDIKTPDVFDTQKRRVNRGFPSEEGRSSERSGTPRPMRTAEETQPSNPRSKIAKLGVSDGPLWEERAKE